MVKQRVYKKQSWADGEALINICNYFPKGRGQSGPAWQPGSTALAFLFTVFFSSVKFQ